MEPALFSAWASQWNLRNSAPRPTSETSAIQRPGQPMESALFSAYYNHARAVTRVTNADATFFVTFDDF